MTSGRACLALGSILIVVVAGFAVPASAQTLRSSSQQPGTWCGGTRWRLMTLSDPQRLAVGWAPRATSIPAIAELAPPRRYPALRNTPFERQVWTATLVIERYRMQSNGEIALELYDVPSATYMNAYMPNPNCLPAATRGRAQILAARDALINACSTPPKYWWPLGATVQLSGVGYWNPVRTTLGALGNGAELRPVVGLKILNGCGKG